MAAQNLSQSIIAIILIVLFVAFTLFLRGKIGKVSGGKTLLEIGDTIALIRFIPILIAVAVLMWIFWPRSGGNKDKEKS